METVALIAAIVSIVLAGFAIWQANHHRDQSDKLNRDTAEKLARIEAFATSTKEEAFAEIKRWGEFARAGAKPPKESTRAEEELKKLKNGIWTNTSAEIDRVREALEKKLSSVPGSSALTEIRKEFEELRTQVGKIQEKGIGEAQRLEQEETFRRYWSALSEGQQKLLRKLPLRPGGKGSYPLDVFAEAGLESPAQVQAFLEQCITRGILAHSRREGVFAGVVPTVDFLNFLKAIGQDEVERNVHTDPKG